MNEQDSTELLPYSQKESVAKKDIFKTKLNTTIDAIILGTLEKKQADSNYLNYVDAVMISNSIKNIFIHKIGLVPDYIEATLESCMVILAPNIIAKKEHLKKAVGLGGGLAGIGIILTSIGTAIGLGSGAISAIVAFFVGTSWTGPLFAALGGAALVGVAGYFALSDDGAENSEKYIKALHEGMNAAVDQLWEKYKQQLTD